MIIVTGGAGFIGSHIIEALNEQGRDDVLVVDEFADGHKLMNLAGLRFLDLMDRSEFLDRVEAGDDFSEPIRAILHQGACSDTTAWDGNFVLSRNYEDSKALLAYANDLRIPFIYASSAAVYGGSRSFREQPSDEKPLNLYALSKLLFDRWVRRMQPRLHCPVVGLRYFNVYGPREAHKGAQASVVYKHYRQLRSSGTVELFQGSAGYADGAQQRDFVWAGDCAKVNLWFLENPDTGIFNVGTGRARSFNDLAGAVLNHHGRGEIRYVPFPEALREHYQSYTCADLTELRKAGYSDAFLPIEEGVPRYLRWLESQDGAAADA